MGRKHTPSKYQVGVYYEDEDRCEVGVLPPPERLMRSFEEFYETVGIKVTVTQIKKDLDVV